MKPMIKRIFLCFVLMRPAHWIKNGLILLPLFFSQRCNATTFVSAIIAFANFSLAASSVYVLNDICDVRKDRKHPQKCRRPVASGAIPVSLAVCLFVLLLGSSIAIDLLLAENNGGIRTSLIILIVYLILNIGYSIRWKNVPIVDITILASGFLLRILYGSEFYGIQTSPWLFLCILAISLYMGIGKRRNELKEMGRESQTRPVLQFYTLEFFEKNMYLSAGIAIVFYSLWTFSADPDSLAIWTIPFVILAFLRYNFVLEIKNSNGDPVELILTDRPLLLLGTITALLLISQLYGKTICNLVMNVFSP